MRTCGSTANGSPEQQRRLARGRPGLLPWRRTRRQPRRALPCGPRPRPAPPRGRLRPRREPSRHERRRHRRTAAGSPRRPEAHHGRRLAFVRWRPGGDDPPAPPPRTTTAPAQRSPPPTPRRSAGRPDSVSAQSPRHDHRTGSPRERSPWTPRRLCWGQPREAVRVVVAAPRPCNWHAAGAGGALLLAPCASDGCWRSAPSGLAVAESVPMDCVHGVEPPGSRSPGPQRRLRGSPDPIKEST